MVASVFEHAILDLVALWLEWLDAVPRHAFDKDAFVIVHVYLNLWGGVIVIPINDDQLKRCS